MGLVVVVVVVVVVLYFGCILISRLFNVENLRHFNLAYFLLIFLSSLFPVSVDVYTCTVY